MCVPSLNEICESMFGLTCTQVKAYCGIAMDVKPEYPGLSSGDIIIQPTFQLKHLSLYDMKS